MKETIDKQARQELLETVKNLTTSLQKIQQKIKRRATNQAADEISTLLGQKASGPDAPNNRGNKPAEGYAGPVKNTHPKP